MTSPTPVFDVPRSNDPKLDGLLQGSVWGTLDITYTMPAIVDYYFFDGYRAVTDFRPVNNIQIQAIQSSFAQITRFTQATFTLVNPNFQRGDLRFAEAQSYRDPNNDFWQVSTALGNFPEFVNGGDVWFNPFDYNVPNPGTFAHATFMHEIGHALGLKHPHDRSGPFGLLPAQWDSVEFTVMSYRSYVGASRSGYAITPGNFPRTYMMLDILGLQYLYGADFAFNGGNTVYRYNPNTPVIFETIWDGNGNDTYDFSNYATNLRISLRPGEGSVLDPDQLALLNGQLVNSSGANPIHASASVYNALLFNGDLRSLIENANGGSRHDVILGNQVANQINGNAGNDTLQSGSGNDIAIGAAGTDRLLGDAGNDTLDGGPGADVLIGGPGRDLAGYILATAGVTVNLASPGANRGEAAGDSYSSIEDVIGTRFADVIVGNSGANFLGGDAGNDRLSGGSDRDTLAGGTGTDLLSGEFGGDQLTGGLGPDRFIYRNVADSRGSQNDTITDFAGGAGDRISLSAIDAILGPANNRFTFIGSAAFSNDSEGELRYARSGGDVFVFGDIDGDRVADISILLLDLTSLLARDFIL